MGEFINTIDVLGEDAMLDAIINNTLTEFSDDVMTSLKEYAFNSDRDNVTSVNLPNVINAGKGCFNGNRKLLSIDMPKLINIQNSMCYGCDSLIRANFRSATSCDSWSFSGCSALKSIELSITNITSNGSPFSSLYSLTSFILYSKTLCTLDSTSCFRSFYHFTGKQDRTYNPNGDKDGYFYVPSALLDSYKSATNWSTYADRFRAIEDYTVDGTVNGDMDFDKMNGG